MLTWYVKHRVHNSCYFQYGLDIKGTNPDSYLSSSEHARLTKGFGNVEKHGSLLKYNCLLDDKILFSQFCSKNSISTARYRGFVSDGVVYDSRGVAVDDLRSALSEGTDLFVKDAIGGQAGRKTGGVDSSIIHIKSAGEGNWSRDAETLTDGQVLSLLGRGRWVLEDRIVQHPLLAELNPTSVNSVRIYSAIHPNQKPVILGTNLKIGMQGQLLTTFGWAAIM